MPTHNFIDWATNAQTGFAAFSTADQIIAYGLISCLVVLTLALTYGIVKGSLYLAFYSVKGSLYLAYYAVKLSLLIPLGILKIFFEPKKEPIVENEIDSEKTIKIDSNTHLYCSQCGKVFSTAMEEAIHNNGNCYCESCGTKVEIRA